MADFPVPFNDRLISYSAVGGETTFDFDFPVYENTGLSVIRIRSGTVTTLTLTTDYTVSINTDQEADPGGTITPVAAVAASDTWILIGATTIARTSDFAQRGPWPAEDINEQFDRIILMLQEMKRGGLAWDANTTATIGSVPYDIAGGQYIRRNVGNTDWEAATITTSSAVVSASTSVAGIGEIATDAEFIAAAATDKFLVPSNHAANPRISVHKNGSAQGSITSATDVKVTWGTEVKDVGGYFASSAWTPPAGDYFIGAAINFDNTNGVTDERLVIKIFVGGAVAHQTTFGRSLGTNNESCAISAMVTVNGAQSIEIYARKTGAGDGQLDGTASLTYFTGFKV